MMEKYNDIIEALEEYTGEIIANGQENPLLLNINGEDISVYFGKLGPITGEKSNVRHTLSAKNIEIQKQHRGNGFKVAFVGFYQGERNYCAWDPEFIFSSRAETDTSLRADRRYESERLTSPVIDERQNYTSIIMPSYALGPYLENAEALHSLNDYDRVVEALEYGMRSLPESVSRYNYAEPGRQVELKFRRTLIKPRDENFRKDVMHAYGRACCICGLQFEAEAAHIVPHKDERTGQTVRNGLALCPNHHKMYDRHLFKITSEYKISINHEKVNELRKEGLVGGLDVITKLEGRQICLPPDKEAWPSKRYLRLRDQIGTDS